MVMDVKTMKTDEKTMATGLVAVERLAAVHGWFSGWS